MIKQLSFVRLCALSVGIAASALLALAVPTTVHADTQTTATVGFSMADDAAVSIKAMPDIDFGSAQVSTTAKDVAAQTVSAPITVTNPGFSNGWTLSVSASDFSNTAKTRTIKGAQLTFTTATIAAEDSNNVSGKPTTVDGGTTITAGGDAAPLVTAAKGAGVGTYDTDYAPQAVSLHVPSGNVAADYTADLNWTMETVPEG